MRMKKIQEGLGDMAHRAEMDHEVQMARSDLYKIAKYAIKLHDMLKTVSEAEGIEGWQQAKITKAADYISSVYHAMDYDMKFANGGQMAPEMPVESKNYVESLQAKLAEKAVSQSQQQAAGIALSHKKKGTKPESGTASASMMNMSVAELEKLAGTKHKGLPDHVDEGLCPDCGKPSYTILPEEKQKGIDGKVCWKGYRRQGTKMKGGRRVDNCVKVGEGVEDTSDIQQADAYTDAVNAAIANKQMTFINPSTGKEESVMNPRTVQKFDGDEAAATAYFKYTMQYPLTSEDKTVLRPWLDRNGNLMRKRIDQFTSDEKQRYGLENRN